MYTNIILNTLPLRKSYGIPFLIVHLEMQFFIRIYRMDVIAEFVLTRGNTIFWFTSSTFIFDRGKTAIIVHLSVLPVDLKCNFSQHNVNQLATYFGHNNNLDILVYYHWQDPSPVLPLLKTMS